MKHIVILGDGMADLPIRKLGSRTPLMAARKPSMDKLARDGRCGLLKTVPSDMPAGSAVANMGVLGYDVHKVYEGRGVLEAASMGISVGDNDLALRCNLICVEGGKIKNHSAGYISTEEAQELIEFLNRGLATDNARFYPGVSYRHLLLVKGGNKHIDCTPPHDVPGKEFMPLLVKAADDPEQSDSRMSAEQTAILLNDLILKSQKLLAAHPVNVRRVAEGKDPANSIWPWSPGYRPEMPSFRELCGIEKSSVISAVDLIQGIGVYAGMDIIKVKGATGLYDTNYEGKAEAAIDALKKGCQFVYLHVEASDEAGHEGDADLKVRTIEYLDSRIIRPIVQAAGSMAEPLAIAVLPDHPTPCDVRTHTREPVPFLIYKPGNPADEVRVFDEISVRKGSYGILEGNEFIKAFLS
ncbi:MAG: cofactor-independent phosphoglycerate mutase [Bacteroidales bacterium]|jgi:2,3-bisphosphoglycerate-independent phosphoglycerate mutase|nr:cofactor-independent phosphoglycerate mutase [Bacteroidales bacterium]MCI1786204.1 cofactor-independent phosphoglycerate mutase [Bacteroidales bacterium]